MFKKLLNSIGIGTATVNLELHNEHVRVGEEVTGIVYVKGGSDATKVDAIHVDLTMQGIYERDDQKYSATRKLHRVTVTTGLQVAPGEQLSFPFRTTLPYVPQSTRYVRYSFNTSLDIPAAIDKHDHDEIIVYPSPEVQAIHDAFELLGFKQSHASGMFNEKGHQEFEYKPAGGKYRGRVDEIEVVFAPRHDGILVLIELERKVGGLFGALLDDLDLNESKHAVLLTPSHLRSKQTVADAISHFIDTHL